MRKNAFNAVDHIKRFNECKNQVSEITFKTLQAILKDCGIPSNRIVSQEFLKSELFIKIDKDEYRWKSADPVHFSVIQNIYSKYQDKVNGYSRKYVSRKAAKEVLETKKVQECIEILKKKGFIIFSPVSDLFKKL